MPLHIFAKLFPRNITAVIFHIHYMPLMAYSGSNIPQFGAPDTAIEWTLKCHQQSKVSPDQMVCSRQPWTSHMWSSFHIKTEIVQLNCMVKLTSRPDPPSPPKKPTSEHAKVRPDLTSPLNSSKDLSKVYPNWFEDIGQFPGTYHITLHDDAKPVVHAPRKCPITNGPLVHEKLDEFIDQGIIVPVEEPTGSLHLPSHGKQMGNYKSVWTPKDLNTAIRHDHYKTPTVEEITHELAGSTYSTKLDGTSSYLCIVLDYESSLLMTFNTL